MLSEHTHTYTHTHTWARVETELRGALQGVDEWGLAKLPRGVQISRIHKQHSGPCGGEGGMKEIKFTTHGVGKRRGKKWSERQSYGENMWSLVRRKDRHRETGYRLKWHSENWFFHRPHPQLNWWHSSEWVYGLMDYQRVWHSPYLAQAWSISWQSEGWDASQSCRASSELSLAAQDLCP